MKKLEIAIFALAATVIAGCTEKQEEPAAPAPAPEAPAAEEVLVESVSRMKDPEYVKALKDQRAVQKRAMSRIAKAREALEAAKNAGADTTAAEAELKAAYEAFEANRAEARRIVREKISKTNNAQQKGN